MFLRLVPQADARNVSATDYMRSFANAWNNTPNTGTQSSPSLRHNNNSNISAIHHPSHRNTHSIDATVVDFAPPTVSTAAADVWHRQQMVKNITPIKEVG